MRVLVTSSRVPEGRGVMGDTRFVETEILLAVMADDQPKAAQLLDTLLPRELQELIEAATMMALLANQVAVLRSLGLAKP